MESALHLGNTIHESGSMDKDAKVKRAAFIRESTDLRETFGFASPTEVLRAVKLYAGSHYGSSLWKLGGESAGQYYTAWQTCVKLAWHVPRQTHTYLVDNFLCSGLSSVRADILSRYLKFVQGLKMSPSREVTVMCGVVEGDVTTTTGQNLDLIRRETGLDPPASSATRVKAAILSRVQKVPELDTWRLENLGKLLEARGEAHYECEDTNQLTS